VTVVPPALVVPPLTVELLVKPPLAVVPPVLVVPPLKVELPLEPPLANVPPVLVVPPLTVELLLEPPVAVVPPVLVELALTVVPPLAVVPPLLLAPPLLLVPPVAPLFVPLLLLQPKRQSGAATKARVKNRMLTVIIEKSPFCRQDIAVHLLKRTHSTRLKAAGPAGVVPDGSTHLAQPRA
jgi:hypothetical protein